MSSRAAEVWELFLANRTQLVVGGMGDPLGVNHGEVARKAASCGIEPSPEWWELFLLLEKEWLGYVNKPKETAAAPPRGEDADVGEGL